MPVFSTQPSEIIPTLTHYHAELRNLLMRIQHGITQLEQNARLSVNYKKSVEDGIEIAETYILEATENSDVFQKQLLTLRQRWLPLLGVDTVPQLNPLIYLFLSLLTRIAPTKNSTINGKYVCPVTQSPLSTSDAQIYFAADGHAYELESMLEHANRELARISRISDMFRLSPIKVNGIPVFSLIEQLVIVQRNPQLLQIPVNAAPDRRRINGPGFFEDTQAVARGVVGFRMARNFERVHDELRGRARPLLSLIFISSILYDVYISLDALYRGQNDRNYPTTHLAVMSVAESLIALLALLRIVPAVINEVASVIRIRGVLQGEPSNAAVELPRVNTESEIVSSAFEQENVLPSSLENADFLAARRRYLGLFAHNNNPCVTASTTVVRHTM